MKFPPAAMSSSRVNAIPLMSIGTWSFWTSELRHGAALTISRTSIHLTPWAFERAFFDTQPPRVRLNCKSWTWHLWTCDMAWVATTVASLLSNWHFLLGRVLKHWLSRRFLRNLQHRNGFGAVDRLLRNLGGVFCLDGNLDSSGEVEVVRLHLKKCLNCSPSK